jgi:hypothetical protein
MEAGSTKVGGDIRQTQTVIDSKDTPTESALATCSMILASLGGTQLFLSAFGSPIALKFQRARVK